MPGSGAYLILTDETGNAYSFPSTFWIDSGSLPNNSNILNSFYAAGGREIADGFAQARNVTISGILQGDTIADFEAKKRALNQACFKGGNLEISNDVVDRYISVKWINFDYDQEQGQQLQRVTITFVAQFPFWVDSIENEHQEILSGDSNFSVDTTGTDFIIFPRFQFESTDTGGLPGVTLRNNSDGAARFTYSDSQFQTGDILIIDSSRGTVKLNNGDRISNFRPANFLRLQPGVNNMEYEGAGCILTVYYRRVYA